SEGQGTGRFWAAPLSKTERSGAAGCSRKLTQVTACSGVQHSRTGQVCDSPPRSTVNFPPRSQESHRMERKSGGWVLQEACKIFLRLRQRPPLQKSLLSGTPSPSDSKGQAFCPALWHSPNISAYPVFFSRQALLVLSSDGPLLATVLAVLRFRLATSRCLTSEPMPSPESGLRVPLHGSGRRSDEAGPVCSSTGTASRFLTTGTDRFNGPGHQTACRLRYPWSIGDRKNTIFHFRNPQSNLAPSVDGSELVPYQNDEMVLIRSITKKNGRRPRAGGHSQLSAAGEKEVIKKDSGLFVPRLFVGTTQQTKTLPPPTTAIATFVQQRRAKHTTAPRAKRNPVTTSALDRFSLSTSEDFRRIRVYAIYLPLAQSPTQPLINFKVDALPASDGARWGNWL
ncbi:hypothetical protein CORC01_00543, partial [Colletotrichum orchidophilum]